MATELWAPCGTMMSAKCLLSFQGMIGREYVFGGVSVLCVRVCDKGCRQRDETLDPSPLIKATVKSSVMNSIHTNRPHHDRGQDFTNHRQPPLTHPHSAGIPEGGGREGVGAHLGSTYASCMGLTVVKYCDTIESKDLPRSTRSRSMRRRIRRSASTST
jgi:hypothetical protein